MISVPIRFERIFLEKVWGGRRLETTPGIELPDGVRVGETWELVDREDENSIAANGRDSGRDSGQDSGQHSGRTLHELVTDDARAILGDSTPNSKGRFPLLVKYIDASEALSIQVHPDDESAARLGKGAEGKTEAWYILAAEPGALIYAGLKPGVTREEFAVYAGESGVDELLMSWEVTAGDCVTIPGGTIHAIGAGVTLLEVQQNSNTTYRVWDWGRLGLNGKPRETHLEQALDVISFGGRARPPVSASRQAIGESLSRARQSQTDFFALDSLELRGAAEFSTRGRFEILAVTRGYGLLEAAGSNVREELRPGDTWLLPASLGNYRLSSADESIGIVSMTDGFR